MKHNQERTIQLSHGAFTLVEMLVVIAIIAIMAGILIPMVGRAKTKAKVAAARVEMAGMELAIKSYHNDYSRWPLPKNWSVLGGGSGPGPGGDFTYGTSKGVGRLANEVLMEILMAKAGEHNTGHERNPKKNKYIEPKESGETNDLPGFSTAGRYHDPFGNEYNISFDLSGDGLCCDSVYSSTFYVGSNAGDVVGLARLKEIDPMALNDFYVHKGEVMIWSFGPDKRLGSFDEDGSLIKGSVARSDNILSWR